MARRRDTRDRERARQEGKRRQKKIDIEGGWVGQYISLTWCM